MSKEPAPPLEVVDPLDPLDPLAPLVPLDPLDPLETVPPDDEDEPPPLEDDEPPLLDAPSTPVTDPPQATRPAIIGKRTEKRAWWRRMEKRKASSVPCGKPRFFRSDNRACASFLAQTAL